MARTKPTTREPHDYDDIPGTFVFDAEKSRQGYGINMFCMSLMKDAEPPGVQGGRRRPILKKCPLSSPAQTEAILKARLQPHAGARR